MLSTRRHVRTRRRKPLAHILYSKTHRHVQQNWWHGEDCDDQSKEYRSKILHGGHVVDERLVDERHVYDLEKNDENLLSEQRWEMLTIGPKEV